jgi:drug/metabolite transporter (DMT)-like permease
VLLLPLLRNGRSGSILGELLGLVCSVLWTNYGVQCRALARRLSAAEVTAHTFVRAGVLLAPFVMVELSSTRLVWRTGLVLVQLFCILGGSVAAFVFWNNGLRHWKTSRVYLFNNFIPLSNMAWANVCLGEPFTATFWVAMALIAGGVVAGQASWRRVDIGEQSLKSPAG